MVQPHTILLCVFTVHGVMVVRLRLAVHGARNSRIFHLVAINSRKRRNAKPIEKLGEFDPSPKQDNTKVIQWNTPRIKHWLSVGAQPSDRFVQLLEIVLYPLAAPAS